MCQKRKRKKPLFLINPEITFYSKKIYLRRGLLILPGHYAEIERSAECHLNYVDYNGKKNLKASGILQLVFSMKLITKWSLFADYLSKLKKNMIIKKLIKQKKELEKIIL